MEHGHVGRKGEVCWGVEDRQAMDSDTLTHTHTHKHTEVPLTWYSHLKDHTHTHRDTHTHTHVHRVRELRILATSVAHGRSRTLTTIIKGPPHRRRAYALRPSQAQSQTVPCHIRQRSNTADTKKAHVTDHRPLDACTTLVYGSYYDNYVHASEASTR